jgi:hypothetical protein
MNIIETLIVCRISNGVVRIPTFFKVYVIDWTVSSDKSDEIRTGYILDDRGIMSLISLRELNDLKSNMLELGL